jgi:hypothetical protein
VRRVLSVARPDRVILFGAAVAGQVTKILANTHERSEQIRGALDDIGYPVTS